MLVIFHGFVGVGVGRLILAVDMGVRVDMGMLMGMHQNPMGVLVCMGVAMGVGMLQRNGILDHQHSRPNHNGKPHIKLDTRPFLQYHHPKQYAQKRRNGVICTGFGCAQILLRLDVEIDAQPYATKPSSITTGIHPMAGNFSPTISATTMLPRPEKIPLMVVI